MIADRVSVKRICVKSGGRDDDKYVDKYAGIIGVECVDGVFYITHGCTGCSK